MLTFEVRTYREYVRKGNAYVLKYGHVGNTQGNLYFNVRTCKETSSFPRPQSSYHPQDGLIGRFTYIYTYMYVCVYIHIYQLMDVS